MNTKERLEYLNKRIKEEVDQYFSKLDTDDFDKHNIDVSRSRVKNTILKKPNKIEIK